MKMKFIVYLSIISILFIGTSCGDSAGNEGEQSAEVRKAEGGRVYGGVLNLNESEYIKSLFPHSIVDAYSYRVATQVYEGLFKFDQDSLNIINGLAESYELDESRTVYTFKLRQGVFFHDDACFPDGKGREMTADDVASCFALLCTQSPVNQGFHVFDGLLKGANEYYDSSADGSKPEGYPSGIEVVDKYTFKMNLLQPNSLFITKLARPEALIFAPEAYEKYGLEMRSKGAGTGPFYIDAVDEGISIVLKRNENYYGKDQFGNALPFLDAIRIRFITDKNIEMLEFKQQKLDMMYRLPTDVIAEILTETSMNPEGALAGYDLQREPEMQTQLYSFMNMGPPFDNVNVRKAISFAVDRERILNHVLSREGFKTGVNGITPPSFHDYDVDKIPGYTFNLDSAQYFMRKAGYSRENPFPEITLDLNADGNRHVNVAKEFKKQMKDNLNIDVKLNITPHAQISEKCTSGNYSLIRLSWLADFPSPEAFLWMFNGKDVPSKIGEPSYPNIPRYINPEFDKLYQKALDAETREEAMRNFMLAEQTMIKDAPVLILWYDEAYRLLQKHVKNLPNNPMQYRDFSEVYIDKTVEETE